MRRKDQPPSPPSVTIKVSFPQPPTAVQTPLHAGVYSRQAGPTPFSPPPPPQGDSLCGKGSELHGFFCSLAPKLVFLIKADSKNRLGYPTPVFLGFPGGSAGKESACNVGDLGSIPGLGDTLEKGLPTPVFWPGEFHGLPGELHSLWGWKELYTSE